MKPSACLRGSSEEDGLPWSRRAAEHTPSPEAGVRLHPVCGPSVPGGGLVTLLTRASKLGRQGRQRLCGPLALTP